MHLIETYSSSCGLTIDKPFLYESYFPIPFEKYVVLHAGAGSSARIYDYYGDVLDILIPLIKDKGYAVIQIGSNKDTGVKGTVDFRGVTNLHQSAYLIRGCSLFIGNDSCNMHVASGSNVPIVALFSTVYPRISEPYFSDKEKVRLIMGDLKGQKPSFALEEADKVINRIKPEEIVKAALELLGFKNKITRQSIFMGRQYHLYNIDLIPNCIMSKEVFQEIIPTIRMDLEFNEDYLVANLRNRPFHVLTDKPVSIDILKSFRQNIKTLVYEVKPGYDLEFIEKVRKAGINYVLYTLNPESIPDAKLDFFDYGILVEGVKRGKETLEEYPNISKESKYKTNKFILSNDKIYLNKYRWKEGKSVEDFTQNTDTVTLEPEFFDYSEHFYVFNK